jgi:hypothetical protein
MDTVIAAAIADVEAMGFSTGTPQGKQALIEAIERRLLDTKAAVGEGTADAGTHAAASRRPPRDTAGSAPTPRGPDTDDDERMPMSGMPMGAMMPSMGGGMGGGGMGGALGGLMPTAALQA